MRVFTPTRARLPARYDDHVIGLLQGVFEKNALSFNPGSDQNASILENYTDVREVQRQLKAQEGHSGRRRMRQRRGRRASS